MLVVSSLEHRWGADENRSFRCPLPGHAGTARLVDADGDLRLGCCSGRWRSLGEVRAAESYGRDVQLSNIELATWTRRVAYEASAFTPYPVTVPSLPAGALDHVERARFGFRLLVGLRWKDGAHRPVAFAVRFGAAWSDLTFREAHLGIQELRRLGVMVEVDRIGRTPLYTPGVVS